MTYWPARCAVSAAVLCGAVLCGAVLRCSGVERSDGELGGEAVLRLHHMQPGQHVAHLLHALSGPGCSPPILLPAFCPLTAAGSADLIWLCRELQKVIGATLDPQAAYLCIRGIKTLSLRVKQQNASAMTLAEVRGAGRGCLRCDGALACVCWVVCVLGRGGGGR